MVCSKETQLFIPVHNNMSGCFQRIEFLSPQKGQQKVVTVDVDWALLFGVEKGLLLVLLAIASSSSCSRTSRELLRSSVLSSASVSSRRINPSEVVLWFNHSGHEFLSPANPLVQPVGLCVRKSHVIVSSEGRRCLIKDGKVYLANCEIG